MYIALHYQVPTGFAADTDIREFINGNIEREEYLRKSIQENFVERLFDLITQNIDIVKNSQIFGILSALYNVFLHSDYLASFENAVHGFFGFDPFRNIIWITYSLINKSEDKLQLIQELFDHNKWLPITADILRRLMVQNKELKTDDPRLLEEKWVTGNEYSAIKEQWIQVAISELENGDLLNSFHASHVFFILYRVAEDRTQRLFTKWLNQNNGVEKIATLIGRCGTDSTNGPYVEIDEQMLSKLLDFEKLKEKVDAELSSGKELSNYLKAVYLNISTGDKYYLNDASKGEKF